MNLSTFILQVNPANAHIGFWDILDFAIVAYLIYTLYKLLRGTVAFNIFIGVMLLYVLWWTVSAMNMHILSSILDQFVSVGVIVIVIIFQPEIRRFLVMVGSTTFKSKLEEFEAFFRKGMKGQEETTPKWMNHLEEGLRSLKDKSMSALIVISKNLSHESLINSGVKLNALVSKELLESLASSTSPLHDGALVIHNGKLVSAGCTLPVVSRQKVQLSIKERSALGLSEQSQSLVLIIEPGSDYKYALGSEINHVDHAKDLIAIVKKHAETTFSV